MWFGSVVVVVVVMDDGGCSLFDSKVCLFGLDV